MLSQHCGRGKSQWKNSPRRPTYTALAHRARNGEGYSRQGRNNRQSLSVSISEEVQRPTLKNHRSFDEASVVNGHEDVFEKEYVELETEGLPAKTDTTTSTDLKNDFRREMNRSVSRGSSDSSQVTVTTSVSKKLNEGNNNTAFNNNGNYENDRVSKKSQATREQPRSQKTVVLGESHSIFKLYFYRSITLQVPTMGTGVSMKQESPCSIFQVIRIILK